MQGSGPRPLEQGSKRRSLNAVPFAAPDSETTGGLSMRPGLWGAGGRSPPGARATTSNPKHDTVRYFRPDGIQRETRSAEQETWRAGELSTTSGMEYLHKGAGVGLRLKGGRPQGSAANASKSGWPRLEKRLGSRRGRLQNRCSCNGELDGCGWSEADGYCWGPTPCLRSGTRILCSSEAGTNNADLQNEHPLVSTISGYHFKLECPMSWASCFLDWAWTSFNCQGHVLHNI